MPKPKILFFLISLFFLTHCNDIHEVIPSIPVNIILDTNTDLANLGVGNSIICPKPGGYMGIVIYRSDLDRYFAFERTCSYYPNDTSAVEIEKGSNILYCPKCGSKYVITEDEAMVLQGPANMSLKSYRTFINSNRLYITN